jgi:hypothetical protein|uniref:hypothetical protein n=1 Tax=Fluviicola sp. TaxID=1917219 RepID=UPI00404A9FA3
MSKKKSIISYEKLTIEQKKELLIAFPDGFAGAMTKMTNPITGDIFDSLLWETEEAIYLVKLPKVAIKVPSVDDDEEDFDDDFEAVDAKEDDDESTDDDDDIDSFDDKADDADEADEDED